MATWFDESRLDDEAALATADVRLRELAESGARVRREAAESEADGPIGRRFSPRGACGVEPGWPTRSRRPLPPR